MRKAVFFDIDGTIWDERQRIPDSTREAFLKMKEQGHYLFISSGRTRVFIPDTPLTGYWQAAGLMVSSRGKRSFIIRFRWKRFSISMNFCGKWRRHMCWKGAI